MISWNITTQGFDGIVPTNSEEKETLGSKLKGRNGTTIVRTDKLKQNLTYSTT